jgi:predicted dehydrogenase
MTREKLRVGVVGAGTWAEVAHIPGWQRDPRCEIVAICDKRAERAKDFARHFGIPEATDDWQALVSRPDLDAVDVVTSTPAHFDISWAALETGKHVLCEKPVAYDFHDTLRAAELAKSRGLKTKLGFTFRYSPGVQYAKSLIDEGFTGTPFILNAYEQNSQWLDPQVPLRQMPRHPPAWLMDHPVDPAAIQTRSLEGYGAPVIDIGRWWVGADYRQVIGTMQNFVPQRMVRDTGRMTPINMDDGDVFLAEYTNGAIGSVQTSLVTIGNYPGIEVRIFGSKGAIICRLVEEFGIAETMKLATPDAVEFKQVEIPQRFYPAGGHPGESWRSLFYANLIKDFIDEILEGGERNQGNFEDGAWVQEVINAVELSFHERRWVELPLER